MQKLITPFIYIKYVGKFTYLKHLDIHLNTVFLWGLLFVLFVGFMYSYNWYHTHPN